MVKNNELSLGDRVKRRIAIPTAILLGAGALAACTPSASAEKGPENTTPAATAPATPGASETTSTPTQTKETKPWSPADLEVKEPAFPLTPDIQKLWDGSLGDVLAATDTQRLTLAHAMITPEQLEANMKNDPYSKEFLPFLAAPTEKDSGQQIVTYNLVKTLQTGDGRVFHKSSGGLDAQKALKYLATQYHDPANSPNFKTLQPILLSLDGTRGSNITERTTVTSEGAPKEEVIDGQKTLLREFQGTDTEVGAVDLKYAFLKDQNGVGEYLIVDH